jgi:hypothetical protein
VPTLGQGGFVDARATCPAGKRVIGGGAQTLNAGRSLTLVNSYPDAATQSWYVEGRNNTSVVAGWNVDLVAYAVCAAVE